MPREIRCSLTYFVLSGRSSRHIATTSSAKGGRSKKEFVVVVVVVVVFAGDISGEDGDDGGVCRACGVKFALDDTDESERSDNCGEFSDDEDASLYLKYFSDALSVSPVITERYGFTVSS
jgi:hypothetical protein